ncbi:MAG: acyltransferase family protein [Gemmatimonadaceae bacterium]
MVSSARPDAARVRVDREIHARSEDAAVTSPRGRLESVEAARVLAIVAVLVIHATPFAHRTPPVRVGNVWDMATIANQLARWAVPAFFVWSGYFWADGLAARGAFAHGAFVRPHVHSALIWQATGRMVRRLATLFAAWGVIFVLPYEGHLFQQATGLAVWQAWSHALSRNVHWIVTHPGTVFLQGTNGHLWFLMALISAVTVSALVLTLQTAKPLGILTTLALLLYGLFLLMEPYSKTRFGIPVAFNGRNGPMLSLLFFVMGLQLQRAGRRPTWVWQGALLLIVGAVMSVAELTWLRGRGVSLAQDAVGGTVLVGTGVAMLTLANPRWLQWRALSALAPSVLGVYLVHPVFVDLLEPLVIRAANPWVDLAELLLIFGLSLGVVRLMARNPWTRAIVQ